MAKLLLFRSPYLCPSYLLARTQTPLSVSGGDRGKDFILFWVWLVCSSWPHQKKVERIPLSLARQPNSLLSQNRSSRKRSPLAKQPAHQAERRGGPPVSGVHGSDTNLSPASVTGPLVGVPFEGGFPPRPCQVVRLRLSA